MTFQVMDRIKIGGINFHLAWSPEIPFKELVDSNLITLDDSAVYDFSTDCGRGYVAQWNLIDNKLYLESLDRCPYLVNGDKLFAYWCSGDLFVISPSRSDGENIIFNWTDIKINIENGTLMDRSYNVIKADDDYFIWMLSRQ